MSEQKQPHIFVPVILYNMDNKAKSGEVHSSSKIHPGIISMPRLDVAVLMQYILATHILGIDSINVETLAVIDYALVI